MLVIHFYYLSCIVFELYADRYFHSSKTGALLENRFRQYIYTHIIVGHATYQQLEV